jgi:hypothetical protein
LLIGRLTAKGGTFMKLSKAFVRLALVRSLIAIITSAGLVGCSQPNGNAPSTMRFELPDLSSLRQAGNTASKAGDNSALDDSYVYQRVMINVTGPNIPQPIVRIWDQGQNGVGAVPPSSFEITVPKGSSRLIQILIAAGKSSTPGMVLLYGDNVVTLQNDVENADITVKAVSVQGNADGGIAGRYLLADGTGPTGKVDMRFVAPGKPPMIVQQTEIHGGWFNFFAASGLTFQYILEDGRDLFPGYSIDDINAVPGLPRNMLVTVPSNFRQQNGGWTASNPWRLHLGFFGEGAAGHYMCYDASASPMANLKTAADGLTSVPWSGASAPTAAQAGVAKGGVAVAGGNCPALGSLYTNWIKFDQTSVSDTHQALPIRGPFQALSTAGGGATFVQAQTTANVVNVSWAYLPGTTGSSRVSGVGLFVRTLAAAPTNNGGGKSDIEADDGILCNHLTETAFVKQPFTLYNRYPLQNGGAGLQAVALSSVSTTDFNAGKVQFALCPYSDARQDYFNGGVSYGGGNNNGGANQNQLKLVHESGNAGNFANSDNTQQVATCKQYKLLNVDSSGTAVATAAALSIGLPLVASGPTFWSDSGCSTTPLLSASITAGTLSTSLYVLTPGTPNAYSINFNVSGGGTSGGYSTLYVVGASSTAMKMLTQYNGLGKTMIIGQCYPLQFNVVGSGGTPPPDYITSDSGPISFSVSGTGSPTGSFFTDSACTAVVSGGNQVIVPAYTSSLTVYFSPTSMSSVAMANIQGAPTGLVAMAANGFTFDSATIAGFMPILNGGNSNMSLVSGAWWGPGSCSMVGVQPVSANYGTLSGVSSNTVNVAVTGGYFFSDATCSTMLATPQAASIPYGSNTTNQVYFKSSSNLGTFMLTPASGSALNTTVNLLPASVTLQTTGSQVLTGAASLAGIVSAIASLRDGMGGPYSPPIANSLYLDFSSVSGTKLGFAQGSPGGSNCGNSSSIGHLSTPINVAPGQTNAQSLVCSPSATPDSDSFTANVQLVGTGSNVTSAPVALTISATTTGVPVAVKILAPTPTIAGVANIGTGKCEAMNAYLVDANGYWLYGSSASGSTISTTGSTPSLGTNKLYSSNACTGGSTSIAPSPTSATVQFYFMDSSSGIAYSTKPLISVSFSPSGSSGSVTVNGL